MVQRGRSKDARRAAAALLAPVLVTVLAGALAACAAVPREGVRASPSLGPIERALSRDIAVLASDAYGGREAGTPGAQATQQFIVERMKAAGLQPGMASAKDASVEGDGWRQPIDLVRYTPVKLAVRVETSGGLLTLSDRAILSGPQATAGSVRKAPLVGLREGDETLPEGVLQHRALLMDWPQLEGRLRAIRTANPEAVLLTTANEEQFAAAREALRSDEWALADEARAPAWVLVPPEDSARLMRLKETEHRPGGALLPRYRARLDVDFTQTRETMQSANIVGRLPGTRPGAGAVLLLAHWDHLGRCGDGQGGEAICDGAVDNASGVASMLETARLIARRGPLERDLYVVATGAEEWGLLGARAFTEDPPVALPTIVAAFNMDMPAIAPAGSSVSVVGQGRTALDQGIAEVVRALGLTLDTDADHGDYLRRQDGWALLERDIPAVMVTSAYGDRAAFDRFMESVYHTPADRWSPGMELGGAAQDVLLHVALLRHFGDTGRYRVGDE